MSGQGFIRVDYCISITDSNALAPCTMDPIHGDLVKIFFFWGVIELFNRNKYNSLFYTIISVIRCKNDLY